MSLCHPACALMRADPTRLLSGVERVMGFAALLQRRAAQGQVTAALAAALSLAGPDRLPPGLSAQFGLRLAEAKLPSGSSGQEILPAAPLGPQNFLRRLPGGCSLGCHLIPVPPGCPKPRQDLHIPGSSPQPVRSQAGSLWTQPFVPGKVRARRRQCWAGFRQRWGAAVALPQQEAHP